MGACRVWSNRCRADRSAASRWNVQRSFVRRGDGPVRVGTHAADRGHDARARGRAGAARLRRRAEPAFFRAIIRLGSILGTLPAAILKTGAVSMIKRAPVPPERRAELRADFARNKTRDMRRGLREYLRWLHRDDDPARRLCEAGVPVWVVHAEKGDGGLTSHERAVLEASAQVRVVTVPGQVYFLSSNEVPDRIADVIVEALADA
jgi:pimeloyl-ACP methyl ester carboxylesterase